MAWANNILALSIYVMSHHALSRVSFHLKIRQEYLFYNEESFEMLKTGLVELGFPPFLAPVLLIFSEGNGLKWGTWPTAAPFRPIFIAMIILNKI